MSSSKFTYDLPSGAPSPVVREEHIEYGFIGKLQSLKYEYRADIRDRASLERNFREKFEALNRVKLSDGEFARLLDEIVTPDVFTAARTLRSINAFTREDGTPLNYTLVNIKDWCKNTFEVVNQLRINTDYSHHRFDVLILINGVPCVQIELKTLGINPRRAMEQIVEYKNDLGNGYTKTLLSFLQLFIVSNRTNTYYFANNNARHFAFNAYERFLPIYQFADEANRKINQLDEFADKFLVKCTLGQTISRYMVLVASEKKLLMMRPYQVYAVKQIVDCIHQNCGNGYIWHTTGSGKTLTSFKASTLLKDNPDIEKCLFVVDRKDLDRQTREEFNRFQEGCVEENTNTAALVRRLLSDGHADKVTGNRRFNAVLATASINDAIEYHALFQSLQEAKLTADPNFVPLNIACVFSPPADGDADVKQIQEDLPQEKEDNQVDPEGKKAAFKAILAIYIARYGTNHSIGEFDTYYKDVQKRIKDHQWPNADFPAAKKIDITIVVDMLLTGFDSKYLNTLYVDKNLKYHGLIQAFSRTNRVLNGTKPYGNILDFRQQQANVDAAIALFSGEKSAEEARTIWLVDKAPVVIQKLDAAVTKLADFMQSQGLACTPDAVHSLKGDDARAAFIKTFKEVQRLKTQLDQYTDLTEDNAVAIEQILPAEDLQGFRGAYLETAQYFKRYQAQQDKGGDVNRDDAADVNQLDFELVLFASAVIDYDYIMGLMSRYSQGTGKQKMTKDELIGLILADAKFMNERDDIAAYINTLKAGEGLSETVIREGYTRLKKDKDSTELAAIAARHQLDPATLQAFVDGILQRMIFDGEALSDLMAPLDLGWKARAQAELALMKELVPLLVKRAQGRQISGLSAYEQ